MGIQCSRAPNLGGLLIEISVKARRASWGSPCRCGFSHDSAPELGAFCAASGPRTQGVGSPWLERRSNDALNRVSEMTQAAHGRGVRAESR